MNKLVERLGGDSLGGKLFVSYINAPVDLTTTKRGDSAI